MRWAIPDDDRRRRALPAFFELFTTTVQRHDEVPELIVVDTCQRYAVGKDENSSKDMGEVIALLDDLKRRYRAAIRPVHHAGKDSARGARGSNVFSGLPTTILETSKAEDSRLVTLRCVESNNAADGWKESWQIGVTYEFEPKHGTVYLHPVRGADVRTEQEDADRAKAQEAADRVAAIVRREPGIKLTDLRERVGGNHDTADAAIARALATELIVERPGARKARHFYPPDSSGSVGPENPLL
jgi:hypothetical protein